MVYYNKDSSNLRIKPRLQDTPLIATKENILKYQDIINFRHLYFDWQDSYTYIESQDALIPLSDEFPELCI